MIDATRVLPVIFAVLVLLPPVWLPRHFSFALGVIWLGIGWLATILVTALLHHAIGSARDPSEDEDDA